MSANAKFGTSGTGTLTSLDPQLTGAAMSGVLTWANGESGTKSFQIPVLDDQVAEGDETVVFTLSSAAGGAALGSPASTMLTIRDDDGPRPPRRRSVQHGQ